MFQSMHDKPQKDQPVGTDYLVTTRVRTLEEESGIQSLQHQQEVI